MIRGFRGLHARGFGRPILQICSKRTKHSIEREQPIANITCVCFCKTHLANVTKESRESNASLSSISCVWFCKTHLANMLQNNNASRSSHACGHCQSAESPIFDAHFGSENGVSRPHERNKIGDSVLWSVTAMMQLKPF